jgi:16S rRNA (uracil1498-N3)-methyltransferase
MIRLVVAPDQREADRVHLSDAQVHYLGRVMRLDPGDVVQVVLDGHACQAVLEDSATLRLQASAPAAPPPAVAVSLVQALLKGDQMAGLIQRATEAGVDAVQPVVSARSIARTVSAARLQRWRAVAAEATEQSGRGQVPAIAEPVSWARWCPLAPSIALVPTEDPLPGVWAQLGRPERVHLVVGPEGGLAGSEIARCDAVAGLGPRVLRAEHAGAFAIFWLLGSIWQENAAGAKSC